MKKFIVRTPKIRPPCAKGAVAAVITGSPKGTPAFWGEEERGSGRMPALAPAQLSGRRDDETGGS